MALFEREKFALVFRPQAHKYISSADASLFHGFARRGISNEFQVGP